MTIDGDESQPSEIGWYISATHARRAIGYLGVHLAVSGDLRHDFAQPKLLDLWAEALLATMSVDERSPIGPERP